MKNPTEPFVSATYLLVAAINLLPAVGVASAQRLAKIYGIDLGDADVALLMRHRAVLFLVVGGLLLAAVFRSELRTVAGLAGLISMLSFVGLLVWAPVQNPALVRIGWIDGVASALLLAALTVHFVRP